MNNVNHLIFINCIEITNNNYNNDNNTLNYSL